MDEKFISEHEFPIFFSELIPSVQRKLLDFYKVDSPKDLNWDVLPITVLQPYAEVDDEDDD